MKDSFKITFGALTKPIGEQLSAQGCDVDPDQEEFLQGLADSVVKLHVAGLMTDADAHRARKRIVERISALTKRAQAARDAAKEEG